MTNSALPRTIIVGGLVVVDGVTYPFQCLGYTQNPCVLQTKYQNRKAFSLKEPAPVRQMTWGLGLTSYTKDGVTYPFQCFGYTQNPRVLQSKIPKKENV